MANVGVTLHALTKKQGRLRAIANDCVRGVNAELNSAATAMAADLRRYPPPLVNPKTGKLQRYQRTGNLGRNWRVISSPFDFAFALVKAGGALAVSVVNDVQDTGEGYKNYPAGTAQDFIGQEYAANVQDETQQRPIHRGRWTTIQQARAAHVPNLRAACRRVIKQAVDRGGA